MCVASSPSEGLCPYSLALDVFLGMYFVSSLRMRMNLFVVVGSLKMDLLVVVCMRMNLLVVVCKGFVHVWNMFVCV